MIAILIATFVLPKFSRRTVLFGNKILLGIFCGTCAIFSAVGQEWFRILIKLRFYSRPLQNLSNNAVIITVL